MAVTGEEADSVIHEFYNENPGIGHLTILHAPAQEDFYGPENSVEKYGAKIKGAFLPVQRAVQLPLASFRDVGDIRKSLRHEIYGHYGILTLNASDKRSLLEVIIEARQSPSIKAGWAAIDRAYANHSELLKAEEVFCLCSENIDGDFSYARAEAGKTWTAVITNKERLLQRNDLLVIAEAIADGVQRGTRIQQIFPLDNRSQFRICTAEGLVSANSSDTPRVSTALPSAPTGRHIGVVLGIEGGIVFQRVGRGGEVTQHLESMLSAPVAVGDLVDIAYQDGCGVVSGREISSSLER